jgi:hypothetical protein
MEEYEMALSRFSAALTRLERAASRAAGRDDAIKVQAAAIARLKRENEQLRVARTEEERLRNETLAQVDRAMAVVEHALHGQASDMFAKFDVDRASAAFEAEALAAQPTPDEEPGSVADALAPDALAPDALADNDQARLETPIEDVQLTAEDVGKGESKDLEIDHSGETTDQDKDQPLIINSAA